jgi:RNA polymerase primary sigma factor
MPSVTQAHGAASPTTRDVEQPTADAPASTTFVWDDEETDALREARRDAELTASVDSVRAYLKQIAKVALLNAEREVGAGQADRGRPLRRRTAIGGHRCERAKDNLV